MVQSKLAGTLNKLSLFDAKKLKDLRLKAILDSHSRNVSGF